MRKIVSVLCVVAMLLSLIGCGAKEQPDSVVSRYCDAMKNRDVKSMMTYLVGTDSEDENDEIESQEDDGIPEEVLKVAFDEKYSYKIGEVSTEDDKSTVTVEFTYPDFSSAVELAFGEYFGQAFSLALSGASEETLNGLLDNILSEKIKNAESETITSSVKFSCIKTEDGWKIKDVPEDIPNIMTCNIIHALKEIADFDEEFSEEDEADTDIVWHDVPMGEIAELATIKVKVTDCQETSVLKGKRDDIVAQEGTKFVVFMVEIENISKEPIKISGSEFPLSDSQGRTYSVDEDAMFSIENAMLYKEFAPNIPKAYAIVYNVPVNSADYCFTSLKAGTNDGYAFFGQ